MPSPIVKQALKKLEKERLRSEVIQTDPLLGFTPEAILFPEQCAFVRESARFATALCSSRAGKTTALAVDMLQTCMSVQDSLVVYIALTADSAEDIMWPILEQLNRDYKLGGKETQSDLTIQFSNGSRILLKGCPSESRVGLFRGLGNAELIVVDEAQEFGSYLEQLVTDVLILRLFDRNGRLRICGTPGPIPAGYFYRITSSPTWAHHNWDLTKNIHLLRKSKLTPEQLIAQACQLRGVTPDHPSVQREMFGRWVKDESSLLLPYNPTKNDFDKLPDGLWRYILGVDLGMIDSNALVVLAYSPNSPDTYLVEEKLTAGQLPDQLALDIRTLMGRYSFVKMVADCGGLGKMVVEDLKSRHALPLEAAEKSEKMASYAIMANALRTGRLKAHRASRFAQDCDILAIDMDASTPDRLVVKGHSDAVDATLYAFRCSPAYYYKEQPSIPQPGTPEFDKAQEERVFQAHLANLKAKKEQNSNQGLSWQTDNKGLPPWSSWE